MNKSSNKPFYVTTPIYYVNAKPHIGHAYTTVAADCVARFKRLQGTEVFFSTGTDEHGVKIQKKAEEAGESPAAFVDEIALQFQALWKQLNISYTGFIRTTDPAHKKVVQKVLQNLYGVGCEQFKTADDLINGKCPDHDRAPEFVKEDAYLMQMTVLQNELITRIETDELRIAPEQYKTEMLSV